MDMLPELWRVLAACSYILPRHDTGPLTLGLEYCPHEGSVHAVITLVYAPGLWH